MPNKSFYLILLAALLAGFFAAQHLHDSRGTELQSGILLPQPRVLADFALTDHHGQPFNKTRLHGKWTLVFAGFTFCPDVCPTTLATLKQIRQKLAQEKLNLDVLLLSVDPERDTPAQLKTYLQQFDPAFTGATAAEPQLAQFAKDLGVVYLKVAGSSAETYQMDHSAALVLINPQAQVAGYFQPPFDVTLMSKELAAVISKHDS